MAWMCTFAQGLDLTVHIVQVHKHSLKSTTGNLPCHSMQCNIQYCNIVFHFLMAEPQTQWTRVQTLPNSRKIVKHDI